MESPPPLSFLFWFVVHAISTLRIPRIPRGGQLCSRFFRCLFLPISTPIHAAVHKKMFWLTKAHTQQVFAIHTVGAHASYARQDLGRPRPPTLQGLSCSACPVETYSVVVRESRPGVGARYAAEHLQQSRFVVLLCTKYKVRIRCPILRIPTVADAAITYTSRETLTRRPIADNVCVGT